MPEIRVSEEQHEYLEDLRERLADEFVGEYGHVRHRDALQFLIDHHEDAIEDGAAVDAQQETDVDGEAGAADPTELTVDELEDAVEDIDDVEVLEDLLDGERAGDDRKTAKEVIEERIEAIREEAEQAAEERLNAMMNLLETHDGAWEESDDPDARYAVELPDGTTEHVRTKDDVRALLFKHYA